eukprot:TRINITY_DN333_c0_g1_i1.p1 TRINITY_DN333_c0_g1~~TRINITY_DN333_c0_g1_i1.p1  ORF type:complete len:135 (+),score=16.09 TRINITY_DN333_c0_g1_i1:133-537(+)
MPHYYYLCFPLGASSSISCDALLATGAIHTSAAAATLAIATVFCSGYLHHIVVIALLLSLNDFNAIGVSFLYALALVSAAAVTTGGRHVSHTHTKIKQQTRDEMKERNPGYNSLATRHPMQSAIYRGGAGWSTI